MNDRSPLSVLLASLLFLSLLTGLASAGGTDYRLGPQDKIRVKTYEWREVNGEFNDWPALSGDYTVTERGQIVMPVIGEVPAAGHSAAEVAEAVADRLKTKMLMDEKPNVIIDVLEFRPIYVAGEVARPGEYAYREGMILLHVLSISGGQQRGFATDRWQTAKDLVSFKGEFSSLTQSLVRLKARQARLDAEVQHLAAIEFPAELKGSQSERTVAILKEEQSVFGRRREADRQLVVVADNQKALVKSKIAVLEERIGVLVKQRKSAEDALKRLGRLLSRGYLNTIRRLSLERNVVDLESAQLDLRTRIVEAEQEIAKSEKDLLDAQLRLQTENTAELQTTAAKIDETTARLDTLQSLVHEAETAAPGLAASGGSSLRFIIRRGAKVLETTSVDTPIVPGDIITVEQRAPATEGKAELPGEFSTAEGGAQVSR